MKSKLYIMHAGNFIKVGVTSGSIKTRAKQIQTGCPLPIDEALYLEFPTKAMAFNAESEVHRHFKEHKSNGEWFVRFNKYTTKICNLLSLKISDIKSVRISSKNIYAEQKIQKIEAESKVKHLKTILQYEKELLERPKYHEEIIAHLNSSDKHKQKKLAKAIKNNPHVFKDGKLL